MMLRLLERYANVDETPVVSGSVPYETLRASVADHIVSVLSTRPGSVAANPELGIAEWGTPSAQGPIRLEVLCATTCRAINQWEPRVYACRVDVQRAPAMDDVMVTVYGKLSEHAGSREEILVCGGWDTHGVFHVR
jgi:predicted component of type VI protein secretion system